MPPKVSACPESPWGSRRSEFQSLPALWAFDRFPTVSCLHWLQQSNPRSGLSYGTTIFPRTAEDWWVTAGMAARLGRPNRWPTSEYLGTRFIPHCYRLAAVLREKTAPRASSAQSTATPQSQGGSRGRDKPSRSGTAQAECKAWSLLETPGSSVVAATPLEVK